MSYLFWLVVIGTVAAYSLFVGDAMVKIRSDLSAIRSQLTSIAAHLTLSDARGS